MSRVLPKKQTKHTQDSEFCLFFGRIKIKSFKKYTTCLFCVISAIVFVLYRTGVHRFSAVQSVGLGIVGQSLNKDFLIRVEKSCDLSSISHLDTKIPELSIC